MNVNTVKDGSGNNYWLVGDSNGRMIPGLSFDASLQVDVAANDSDKTFTVPASTEWVINHIHVKLTSTGTAGNRQIAVLFTTGSDVTIAEIRVGAVQAASLTRYYQLGKGLPDMTSFRDTDLLTTPLPTDVILPAGYKVRIYDKAAVDAAADDMEIQMLIGVRTV